MEEMESRINSVVREKLNAKVGMHLSKTKASPNLLTLLGVLASFIACLITIRYGLFIGAFAVFLSSLFDAIDGAVAKARNKTTSFGAFLDDVADRIGEFLYFTAILWLQTNFTGFLVVFLAGMSSILVSYFNSSARSWGFKLSSGKVTGRPGRIILLFILMLISPWLAISKTLWLIVLLNVFTLAKRGYEVKKQSA